VSRLVYRTLVREFNQIWNTAWAFRGTSIRRGEIQSCLRLSLADAGRCAFLSIKPRITISPPSEIASFKPSRTIATMPKTSLKSRCPGFQRRPPPPWPELCPPPPKLPPRTEPDLPLKPAPPELGPERDPKFGAAARYCCCDADRYC
jgi:hypothetical protein